MNKKLFSLFLLLIMIGSFGVTALAANYDVVYTTNGDLIAPNINSLTNRIAEMQPDDEVTFAISLQNQNSNTTRWYMSNSINEILEKNDIISGGAYSYVLSYRSPSGATKTFYDSDKVGGEIELETTDHELRQGLEEATVDLEEFFFLDTLNQNEAGTVFLTVKMEGESMGNVYQNTSGEIQINFAVEAVGKNTRAVKTGDESNLTPYYIGMVLAGLLFLYLALDSYTDRKYKYGKGRMSR